MSQEIIEQSDVMSTSIMNKKLNPEMLRAINSLSTGTPPPEAIKTHPGKAGKIFTYVSHIHATKTMNDAFQWLWEYKVLSFEAFDDGSAVALCNLKLFFPLKNGEFITREFQEVGAWESQAVSSKNAPQKIIKGDPLAEPKEEIPLEKESKEERKTREFGMTKAMTIASAASRGLLRCMLRAFNYGSEFYEADEEISNVQAWNQIKIFATGRGISEQELIDFMKERKYKSDQLADRFYEIFTAVYNYQQEKDGIPDDIK